MLASPAFAEERAKLQRAQAIRDVDTEALLHTFANPLLRAAGLESGLVRKSWSGTVP